MLFAHTHNGCEAYACGTHVDGSHMHESHTYRKCVYNICTKYVYKYRYPFAYSDYMCAKN